MPRVTEAIQNFLTARQAIHNDPNLIGRILTWLRALEIQVNVAADNGERVDGKRNTYTDGEYEWFNIRIPKNAATTPEFHDYELRWPLDLHVEAIGWTGWDWQARRSRAVGFDFDAITGHAKGIGISDKELERIKQAAISLPYVEVRKSTGGKGLHPYVLFDEEGIPTANHTEHAALARCVLGMMSSETGFDFASQIDACGGNMWFWHRKMTPENEGLKLIKPAEKVLSVSDLPPNWRDHIEVVTRRRAKVRIHAELKDEYLDPFEALTSARRAVPLDETHKQIIDELSHTDFTTIWVPDHHLLQTHTCALAKLMKEKAGELKLQGIFKTNSKGTDKGTPNCFMFPLDKGGWRVYRFSPGVNEAETWNQDKEGWTNCYFNCRPNLATAAKAVGGQEDPDHGGFMFQSVSQAREAAENLGQKINFSEDREKALLKYKARLKAHKDGRLVMHIIKRPGQRNKALDGWISKNDKWVKLFDVPTDTKKDEAFDAEYDGIIRQLVSPSREDAGWCLWADDHTWQRFNTEKVKLRLIAMGYPKPQAELILGSTIGKAWKLVNIPFQSEYPGDRQWNVDAAQYAFPPVDLEYDQAPCHPNWDRVLKHCGQDLDRIVREDEWCKLHNIKSGSDFLLYWIAFLLRDPFQPLPYLFLFGNQNSGKSILHQAIGLLMTKGVASADRALTNNNDFNGELANCVLAYIEETNLSANERAYARIKDWTTNDELWIRRMRTDAYKQRNTLHFIQTANKLSNMYVERGDTRVIVIYVADFEPGEEIPKSELKQKLKDEASHFMRTVMDLTMPSPYSRLGLPPLRTPHKDRAEEINSGDLETFIEEQCFRVTGEMVAFSEFYKRFLEWLPIEKRYGWKKSLVLDEIKQRFPYGIHTENKRMIGNLAFEAKTPEPDAKRWIVRDHRLVREGVV